MVQQENRFSRIQNHRNVILIFSVAESKAFQGFARMSCEARHDSQPVQWILPPGLRNRAFSGVIHIDWITRYAINIRRLNSKCFIGFLVEVYPSIRPHYLFNSWNENKQVKIGRDGQVSEE